MRHLHVVPAAALLLVLCACGGGGSGDSAPPAAPVALPPDLVIPPAPVVPPTPGPVPVIPAPPVPAPLPVVSAVGPREANIGTSTIFTVTGINLSNSMKFSLADCANIIELDGGNSTQRQFSCTPTGKAGTHRGAVYASAAAAAPLLEIVVDYQPIVAALVVNLGWRYAVIKSDGSLWSWNPQQSTAVKVGDDYADVAVSLSATLAIKKDGSLWTWGGNSEGILGNGSTENSVSPRQIGTDFVKVVVKGENTTGGESAEALKKDGSLWVWGARSGANPNVFEIQLSPRMVATGFVDIARGSGGESFGVKADGSLWTWTRQFSNQAFVPVKIADGYVTSAASYDATYGLKADRSLWNWGRNAPNREEGFLATAGRPAKVGDGFISISAGIDYALAVKSDGTLWAGGNGLSGQFGDAKSSGGSFRHVNTGIAAAWAGSACSFIRKTDGSLWASGHCDLGDGKSTRYIYTFEPVPL